MWGPQKPERRPELVKIPKVVFGRPLYSIDQSCSASFLQAWLHQVEFSQLFFSLGMPIYSCSCYCDYYYHVVYFTVASTCNRLSPHRKKHSSPSCLFVWVGGHANETFTIWQPRAYHGFQQGSSHPCQGSDFPNAHHSFQPAGPHSGSLDPQPKAEIPKPQTLIQKSCNPKPKPLNSQTRKLLNS